MSRLELRALVPSDETSFLQAVKDFAEDTPLWMFAPYFNEEDAFERYVEKVRV